MVKDLQYFINAENEFCKKHPNYGEHCRPEKIL